MTSGGDARRGRLVELLRRAAFVLAALVAIALLVWYVWIPYPRGLDERNPELTSLMEQRVREARSAGDSLVIRQEWVPLEDISGNLQRAVIVAEDYRFRQHRGIDWVSLAEEVDWSGGDTFAWSSVDDIRALGAALRFVWANRSELRGRSTITQQLAKNLYFGTDRSLLRKGMELVVAGRLERRLGKDRILELYLNVVEWGPGVFGAEAAAQTYFGRSAKSLSLEQAAALAGTLPHPLTSNPATSPARMRWRQNLILARLRPPPGTEPSPIPLPDPNLVIPGSGLDAPVLDPVVIPEVVAPSTPDSATPADPPGPDTVAVPGAPPRDTLLSRAADPAFIFGHDHGITSQAGRRAEVNGLRDPGPGTL
jgi:monofunctional biosynthetic peptidoglycan transglycosylase